LVCEDRIGFPDLSHWHRGAKEGSSWDAFENVSKLNPNLGAPKFAVTPTRHTADQIQAKLRYADVMRKLGQPLQEILRVLDISQDTYYHWSGCQSQPP